MAAAGRRRVARRARRTARAADGDAAATAAAAASDEDDSESDSDDDGGGDGLSHAAEVELAGVELGLRSVRDLSGASTADLLRAFVLSGTPDDAGAVVHAVAAAFVREDRLAAAGLALAVGSDAELDAVAPLADGSAAAGRLDVPVAPSAGGGGGGVGAGTLVLAAAGAPVGGARRRMDAVTALAEARSLISAATGRSSARGALAFAASVDAAALGVTPAFDDEPTFEEWASSSPAPVPPPGPRIAHRPRGHGNAEGTTAAFTVRDGDTGAVGPLGAGGGGAGAAGATGAVGARLTAGTRDAWAGRLLGRTPLPTLARLTSTLLLAMPVVGCGADAVGGGGGGVASAVAAATSADPGADAVTRVLTFEAALAGVTAPPAAAFAALRAAVGARASLAALPEAWTLPCGVAYQLPPGVGQLKLDAWDAGDVLRRAGGGGFGAPSAATAATTAVARVGGRALSPTSAAATSRRAARPAPRRRCRATSPATGGCAACPRRCCCARRTPQRARRHRCGVGRAALLRALSSTLSHERRASELTDGATDALLALATARRVPAPLLRAESGAESTPQEPPLGRLVRRTLGSAVSRAAAAMGARGPRRHGAVATVALSADASSSSDDDGDVPASIVGRWGGSSSRGRAAPDAVLTTCVAVGGALQDALAAAAADAAARGGGVGAALRLSAERDARLHSAAVTLLEAAAGAVGEDRRGGGAVHAAASVVAAPLLLLGARGRSSSGAASSGVSPSSPPSSSPVPPRVLVQACAAAVAGAAAAAPSRRGGDSRQQYLTAAHAASAGSGVSQATAARRVVRASGAAPVELRRAHRRGDGRALATPLGAPETRVRHLLDAAAAHAMAGSAPPPRHRRGGRGGPGGGAGATGALAATIADGCAGEVRGLSSNGLGSRADVCVPLRSQSG